MAGPIAARTRRTDAPCSTMLATAASTTPATSPRRPACTAATIPASASASRTGTQSATSTATATPGDTDTSASASPTVVDPGTGACDTTTTREPWTWVA